MITSPEFGLVVCEACQALQPPRARVKRARLEKMNRTHIIDSRRYAQPPHCSNRLPMVIAARFKRCLTPEEGLRRPGRPEPQECCCHRNEAEMIGVPLVQATAAAPAPALPPGKGSSARCLAVLAGPPASELVVDRPDAGKPAVEDKAAADDMPVADRLAASTRPGGCSLLSL